MTNTDEAQSSPGQWTVLSSARPEVVRKSIMKDLLICLIILGPSGYLFSLALRSSIAEGLELTFGFSIFLLVVAFAMISGAWLLIRVVHDLIAGGKEVEGLIESKWRVAGKRGDAARYYISGPGKKWQVSSALQGKVQVGQRFRAICRAGTGSLIKLEIWEATPGSSSTMGS